MFQKYFHCKTKLQLNQSEPLRYQFRQCIDFIICTGLLYSQFFAVDPYQSQCLSLFAVPAWPWEQALMGNFSCFNNIVMLSMSVFTFKLTAKNSFPSSLSSGTLSALYCLSLHHLESCRTACSTLRQFHLCPYYNPTGDCFLRQIVWTASGCRTTWKWMKLTLLQIIIPAHGTIPFI